MGALIGPSWLTVLLGFIPPLPGTTSVSVALLPPEDCARCHGGGDGKMALEGWQGSPMGHAVRDPVYLAAIGVAERDLPGIGDLCLRCHAPEAWLSLRCIPSDGSRILPGDSGITCSACHRMVGTYGGNGQYLVADDDVLRGPYGQPPADHRSVRSDFLASAELCSTCHNLTNPLMPRRDPATRARMGLNFSEQTTYWEWAASKYAEPGGRSCIQCHMEEDRGPVALSGPARADRSSHQITGANVFLLDALGILEPGLNLEAELEQGRQATRRFLRTAATVELVDRPNLLRRGETTPLSIRVTNLTGHKLPSGYPEQQVFLAMRSAALGLDRGALDPVSGEPQGALETYRTVQGQHDVGPSPHLALADTVFSDNRIPPWGMISTTTIAPVGKVYAEVEPGRLAHWDDVRTTLEVPCSFEGTEIDVELGLYHLSLPQHYVDFLEQETPANTPRGQRLRQSWSRAPARPEEIALLSLHFSVDPGRCADAGVEGTDAVTTPDADSPDRTVGPTDAGSDAGEASTTASCGCASTGAPPAGPGLVAAAAAATLALLRRRTRRLNRRRRLEAPLEAAPRVFARSGCRAKRDWCHSDRMPTPRASTETQMPYRPR